MTKYCKSYNHVPLSPLTEQLSSLTEQLSPLTEQLSPLTEQLSSLTEQLSPLVGELVELLDVDVLVVDWITQRPLVLNEVVADLGVHGIPLTVALQVCAEL